MTETLSVIVPVFNNAESLQELDEEFTKIETALRDLDLSLQLIFVDDGSADVSLAKLIEIQRRRDNAVVVKHTRNFGAVAALKTGYKFVEGNCFMAIAADLQDPVARIVDLAKHWIAGSKFTVLVREKRSDPLPARAFSFLFYRLVRFLVARDYPKTGFDVALMDRQLLPYMQDSAKNINPSIFAHYLGFEPKMVPYRRDKRRYGKSGWTFGKKVRYFLDSIFGFSIAPSRYVTGLGLIVALASLGYGVAVVGSALIFGSPLPGFPALAALISLLSGINLIMTGLVGEYVWRVFDEVNKRPEGVIDIVFKDNEPTTDPTT